MISHETIIDEIYNLYSRSANTDFIKNGFEGIFHTKNDFEIDFIIKIIYEDIIDIEFLDNEDYLDKEDFDLDKYYPYKATPAIKYVNNIYFSTDNFLMKCFECPSIFNESDHIVIPLDERFDLANSKYQEDFFAVTKLVNFLANTYFSTSYSLIVFADNAFTISLPASEGISRKYYEIFENYNDSFANDVSEFLDFFDKNNGETNPHKKEKVRISGNIIKDNLSNPSLVTDEYARIYCLIENFSFICESIEKSYGLYLKNFNYQNIIEQFEDKYKVYIESINNSIKALQGQVLGLPILAAATTLDKISGNPFSFVLLFTYVAFVSLNLNIQYKNLEYIQILVDKIKVNELPESIIADTKSEENSLKEQVNLLKRYFLFIAFMIFCILIYIAISLHRILY